MPKDVIKRKLTDYPLFEDTSLFMVCDDNFISLDNGVIKKWESIARNACFVKRDLYLKIDQLMIGIIWMMMIVRLQLRTTRV